MKNIIVLYTTFLLLSLFSACTTKDKRVVYPTTGGPVVNPTLTKSLIVGSNTIGTSEFSKSGQSITFNAGTSYSVSIIFANADFVAKTYTTSAAPTADNEVTIVITDIANSEAYQVESGKEFKIENKNNGTTDYVSLTLNTSAASPMVDLNRSPINVGFTVEQ